MSHFADIPVVKPERAGIATAILDVRRQDIGLTLPTEIIVTAHSPAMILLGHAVPLNEPIMAHGPFVMNTRDEIAAAIEDYQQGKFGLPQDLSPA